MARERSSARTLLFAAVSVGAVMAVGQQASHALEAASPAVPQAQPLAPIVLAQATAPAAAASNVNAGQDAFMKNCRICHTVAKGGPERFGPNLFGIVGKQAATEANFTYSDAFKKAAVWKWDPAVIGGWISNPAALIPGNAMATFQGVANKDRDNIIAYLATLK